MAKIYYVGDWAIQLGPVFAETPFNYAWKGLDTFNYGHWLKSAIEGSGRHEVTSVSTWDFYKLAPGAYEKILATYDAVIFSDVEAKNFQLAPSFFDRKQFGTKVLTFPDRVRLTVEACKRGVGMLFLGGWLSFNGEMGKGGWGRTRLSEILPVECLETEDLVESTEGFCAQPAGAGWGAKGARSKRSPAAQTILAGVDLTTLPPILGYNRVKPRVGCEVLATWQGSQDPAMSVGQFGKGRVFAYTSDPAPHWGCNFVFWKQYGKLWQNVVDWVAGA